MEREVGLAGRGDWWETRDEGKREIPRLLGGATAQRPLVVG